jgi:hypothetical protein
MTRDDRSSASGACVLQHAAVAHFVVFIIQGKRAVGSAQLIVPAMFHGSTSCGTGGLTTYEFSTHLTVDYF